MEPAAARGRLDQVKKLVTARSVSIFARADFGQFAPLCLVTKNGTPVGPRTPNHSFETLCTRAGVRKIRFHGLCPTCASLLQEQGADARMIMEALGHSSIRVTMDVYTRSYDSTRSARPPRGRPEG